MISVKQKIENTFNFDFYKFDKKIGALLSDPTENKDINTILNLYMYSLSINIKINHMCEDLKCFASMVIIIIGVLRIRINEAHANNFCDACPKNYCC